MFLLKNIIYLSFFDKQEIKTRINTDFHRLITIYIYVFHLRNGIICENLCFKNSD